MWQWRRGRVAGAQPEARWRVAAGEQAIQVTDSAGATTGVALADLTGVAVRTTDGGPFATDVWWLLFGPGGAVACRFPLGATGMEAALDRLGRLPGFDHGAMALAMGSTANEDFLLWRGGDARP